MKKTLLALTLLFAGNFVLLAGPPQYGRGCGPCHPCRPCPPPPPGPRHHHGCSGVVKAAAITSIVASGLSIIRNIAAPTQPVTVVQQPVVVQQQPVVVQQQPVVVQQPVVYTQPAGTVIVR